MSLNKRLLVEFENGSLIILSEWKKECLSKYGMGGIKKRTIEIIKEDLKRLKANKKNE